MKKNIAITLIAAMVLATLTACGSKENAVSTEESSQVSQETENTQSSELADEITKDNVDEYITNEDISFDELVAMTQLGDYSQIESSVVLNEVTEEQVEAEMENYLNYSAVYDHITEGTVEDGDTVNITFVGRMDGEEFDGGSGEFDLTIGSGQFIPGFEEGLIGTSIGDTVRLALTFPDDYVEDLAGKPVEFETTVNYKNGEKRESRLTDEFVNEAFGFESVEVMHDYVMEQMKNSNLQQYQYEINDLVYRHLAGASKIPAIPMPFVDDYTNDAKMYYLDMAAMYGIGEDENYIEQLTGMTEEEFDAEMKVAGVNYYRQEILMEAAAKEMGITISDADYEAYLEQQAEIYGYESKDQLKSELEENDMVDEFKHELLHNKVMEELEKNIV